ncbi:MAG: methylated-DNA--[protein]-cysteine S-methyltransferase [Deltaproteobacteria bacterium]|nr:methylated-DNA--[protein]-cysteine S-methyltransferase [Deltaproteobacteria bacterium]
MNYDWMESPAGDLLIVADDAALRMISFREGSYPGKVPEGWRRGGAVVADATGQLGEYFAGRRQRFDLPLAPSGTAFQLRVWQALREIPYGVTCSYGEQARAMGQPRAVRAVGAANGRNPLPIVVPCHRVIGGDGRLTGYAGGLEIKRFLLELESRHTGVVGRAVPPAAGSRQPVVADPFSQENGAQP